MDKEQSQVLGFFPTRSYWRQDTSSVRVQRALAVLVAGTGGSVLARFVGSELMTRASIAILGSIALGIFFLGLVERNSRRRLKE